MNLETVITPWLIWFALAVGLAFLELFLPGFIVVFFAAGCLVTAGALLIWELGVSMQIFLFIASSVISLVLLRRWLMGVFRGVSPDSLDEDFDDFPRGAHVKVTKPITPGEHGRVQYRGTTWYAAADDTLEEGQTAEILRYADNSRQVFFVRKINQP